MRIGTDASCSVRDRGLAVCSPTVAEQRDEPVLRVVIADDHTMVRSGLRMLLDMETDLEVVAEAGDVAATTACLPERAPDVLIRDVHLGTENGLDAMASLLDASPATGVLVLTMQDDPAFARKALRAGHDLAHHARLTELDGQQPGQARDDHDDRDGDEERGDQRAERLILARRREALVRRTQPGRGREHRLGGLVAGRRGGRALHGDAPE